MIKKRIFISDVHVSLRSADDANKYKHDYRWLSEKQFGNLLAFLRYLKATASREVDRELVILGDLFDNWVCPYDLVPPTMSSIVEAQPHQKLFQSLNDLIASGTRVTYLRGNHDQFITDEELRNQLHEVTIPHGFAGSAAYRDGSIHAEHGSAASMFNAPDRIHGESARIPLGYYISRIQATRVATTGKQGREYATYLDDLLETMVTSQKLAASVFEAVLEEARVPESASIRMTANTAVPIADIKARYANLYDDWCQSHPGFGAGIRSILTEFGYLDDMADQLCKKGGTNIVVVGHKHQPEIDQDSWFVDNRIYANCGAWCEDEDRGSFVEVETTDGEHAVRCMEWKNGDVRRLYDEARVSA